MEVVTDDAGLKDLGDRASVHFWFTADCNYITGTRKRWMYTKEVTSLY